MKITRSFQRRRFQLIRFFSVLGGFLLTLSCIGQEPDKERLSVSYVKKGFSLEQVESIESRISVPTLLRGQNESLYWATHVANTMPTAILPRVQPTKILAREINPKIGEVAMSTSLGQLSLSNFLADEHSFAQGFVAVHKGKVVFEQYPGMRPEQSHLWASNAKPLSSLLIDMLIDEGLIDQQKTFGFYVPDFRGTEWEDIKVIDILDMTPGLDTEEDDRTRKDPNSIAIRTFLAEFNEPHGSTGKVEKLRDVLKSARKIREPGTSFDYGSPVTQALVFLTEAVTQQKWSDAFQDRVWSKLMVEGDLQVHLTPDGVAAVHGLVSSRLRDMARFGMLYTPSWNQVATEQIVSEAALARIRNGVRGEAFYLRGFDGPIFTERLRDKVVSNSRQWDAVFEDGDFFKGGLMGQGLYVSPNRDLVIAYFSTNLDTDLAGYLRTLIRSGLFDSETKTPQIGTSRRN